MRYLAAAIVLFIGVSADVAVYSAAASASASAPVVQTAAQSLTVHKVHVRRLPHPNPFVWSH
ncbi:MAG TPA: hypothetical protein VFE19_09665 [Jatrophihabitantaceae bacterium]|jgi:hypothetical protein|nr:hypothetical protein [Jatrophihabitantaceae bacterium]